MTLSTASSSTLRDEREAVPVSGYRNYWYPALASRALAGKPVAVRLLGEDIVLFRSKGGVYGLQDRCGHRGTPLSIGKVRFPGTITCPYHGWTFDGRGRCVAALNEGPASKIPGKVCIPSYRVEERFGMIWVFIGDIEPPPVEVDIPEALQVTGGQLAFHEEFLWSANWRLAMENVADPSHDKLVHRRSARNLFRQIRVYARMAAVENEEGTGIFIDPGFEPEGVGTEYPGLGRFPRQAWWRRLKGSLKPTVQGRFMSQIKLPGYLQVNSQPWFLVQWSVPVDTFASRQHCWIVWRGTGARAAWGWIYWHAIYRFVMRQFLGQDGWIVEAQQRAASLARPEKLSRNDIGVVRWRKLARNARRTT